MHLRFLFPFSVSLILLQQTFPLFCFVASFCSFILLSFFFSFCSSLIFRLSSWNYHLMLRFLFVSLFLNNYNILFFFFLIDLSILSRIYQLPFILVCSSPLSTALLIHLLQTPISMLIASALSILQLSQCLHLPTSNYPFFLPLPLSPFLPSLLRRPRGLKRDLSNSNRVSRS